MSAHSSHPSTPNAEAAQSASQDHPVNGGGAAYPNFTEDRFKASMLLSAAGDAIGYKVREKSRGHCGGGLKH